MQNQLRAIQRFVHRPVFVVLILVITIILTIVGWQVSSRNMEALAKDRFTFRVKEATSAIEERMRQYEQVLRGAQGMVRVKNDLTRQDWHEYVKALQLEKFFPGIQGLGFTVRIPSDELSRHIEKVRAEGFPEYTVRPADPRPEYHSIVYIEPFSGRNLRAFGFDMYSEPHRRAAMSRARDTGEPSGTAPVILVQETEQDVQNGFLLYLPVYRKGADTSSVEQRRQSLAGFVYAPFRLNDLMKGIMGYRPTDIEFEILDRGAKKLLYDTSPGVSSKVRIRNGFSDSVSIDVAGRNWQIYYSSKANFIPPSEKLIPSILAVGGIVLQLLLFYILWSVSNLARKEYRLLEREKREREKYEIITRTTNDVVWEWDVERNVLTWNENLMRVYGYSDHSLLTASEKFYERIVLEDRPAVRKVIAEALRDRKESWSASYRFLRADNTTAWVLNRARILYDERPGTIMLGSMADITRQKEVEHQLTTFAGNLEMLVAERTRELERSNADLQQFAHVASHELKEPVRKIRTYMNLIKAQSGSFPPDIIQYLQKISVSADRMQSMIEGVLAYATISSVHKKTEKVDLNEVIDAIRSDLDLVITEKKALLEVEQLPVIEGAHILIYQLFYNLVYNSLKFTRAGVAPQIKIRHSLADNNGVPFCRISVVDNGLGFDQDYADQIFASFVRLHSKDEFEGTGLGLSLCKKIAERHGGEIHAFSSSGGGAEFIVLLPLQQRQEFI